MAEIIADYGFQATSEKRCEKSGFTGCGGFGVSALETTLFC
jgi:hypothetical protein